MNDRDPWHPSAQQLHAFSQGRVAAAERVAMQSHLDACANCCALLGQLDDDPFVARLRIVKRRFADRASADSSSHTDLLRGPRGDSPSPLLDGGSVSALDTRLRPSERTETVRPSSAVPKVPGYAILGELGRGGMGVVYQARQLGLNRQVALKVLLAGAHARPDELARFRGEAEAVAQLRHNNVVQIHDIGTHDGLPYFALEYCDGGSLADHTEGQPQPPREAARLVEQLAQVRRPSISWESSTAT